MDPSGSHRAHRASSEEISQNERQRRSQSPTWKIVLIGEEGVGKTSLFERLYKKTFSEHMRSTIGLDQGELTITHEASQTECRINLWDTAGSERHSSITLSYYRGSVAILLVFSLDSKLSLPRLRNWVADAKMFAPTACLFLVGNKWDLTTTLSSDEAVSEVDANQFWSTEFPNDIAAFYRVSAKTGTGISEALQDMCEHIRVKQRLLMGARRSPARENKLVDPSVLLLSQHGHENYGDDEPARKLSCC